MAKPLPPPSTIARRQFLAGPAGAAGLLGAAAVPGAWAAPSRRLDNPFTLGVASGDPTPTGVVLWTRLAPSPLDPDGGMPAGPSRSNGRWPPGRGSATWSAGG